MTRDIQMTCVGYLWSSQQWSKRRLTRGACYGDVAHQREGVVVSMEQMAFDKVKYVIMFGSLGERGWSKRDSGRDLGQSS